MVPLTSGFPPILGPGARVLVLGSLPSVKSIELRQYYGHPRNAFWSIMGELFGAGRSLPYDARKRVLIDHRVAVWDVLASSVRPGSMDAAIERSSAAPNDFETLFSDQPGIHTVFFNGQAAARLFAGLVAPSLENGSNRREYQALPSTSPAHAAMAFDEKLAAWRRVAEAANHP
jgi:hypoxanthine-DNA glycosylase